MCLMCLLTLFCCIHSIARVSWHIAIRLKTLYYSYSAIYAFFVSADKNAVEIRVQNGKPIPAIIESIRSILAGSINGKASFVQLLGVYTRGGHKNAASLH